MPDAQSYDELVKRAEERADQTADPSKVNFLQFLKSGGVIMPTTKDIDPETGEEGEPIRVFLDAAVVKSIITLAEKADQITAEAKKTHDREWEEAKAARYAELVAERDVARQAWRDARPTAEELEDTSMVGDEDASVEARVPYPSQTNDDIFAQVALEVPEPTFHQPQRVLDLVNRINELTKVAFEKRLDIHLRGVIPDKIREFRLAIETEMKKPDQSKLDPAGMVAYNNARESDELIGLSIMSVYNPQTGETEEYSEDKPLGAVAAHQFTTLLPQSELDKLQTAAQGLSYTAVLLDLKTDAGFLSGYADAPAEPVVGTGDQDGEDVGGPAA